MTGLSQGHISKMCRNGKIPGAILIGNSYAIPLEWADAAVRLKETTVSINEAAELAGVTRGAIMLAAKEGRLVKIQHRITRDSLARYIERRIG
ncbi:hypothetical protein B5F39_02895 [Cloacibacillus sp. An23]|nr:hypothetical protein B5F39_02895 [Cloacibacillus sp. An23]